MPMSARTAIISLLAQLVDALAVHPDLAAVGLQQSEDDLEHHRLAGAAGAQDDLGVAAMQREADVLQDHLLVERQRHVVEDDDRRVARSRTPAPSASAVMPATSGCRHAELQSVNTAARSGRA